MYQDDRVERRIRRARETLAALTRVREEATPENVASLHRLHAAHLREAGDLDAAAEAEGRADRAEARGPGRL